MKKSNTIKIFLLILIIALSPFLLRHTGLFSSVIADDQTLEPIEDAYIDEYYKNNNYNTINLHASTFEDIQRFSYLKFEIPENIDVTLAQLKAYCAEVGYYGHSCIQAYSSTNNWEEDTITWNNAPQPLVLLDEDTSGSVGQWDSWTVTSLAQQGGTITIALYIDAAGWDQGVRYYSSEYTQSAFRPYLYLEYTPDAIIWEEDCTDISDWTQANGDSAIDADNGGWGPSIKYNHIVTAGKFAPATPMTTGWWISYPTSGYKNSRWSGIYRQLEVMEFADWQITVNIDFNNYAPGYYSYQGNFELYLLNSAKEPMLRVRYVDSAGSSYQHKLGVSATYFDNDGTETWIFNPGYSNNAYDVNDEWILKQEEGHIKCFWPSPATGLVAGTGVWQDLTDISGVSDLLERGDLTYLLIMQRSRYRAPLSAHINHMSVYTQEVPREPNDGIDRCMLEFINYPELKNQLGGVVRGTAIAILDSGLDPDVYDYVKNDGDPARQYLHATYYEWNSDTNSYDEYTESQKEHWQDDGSSKTGKHGTAMFSAASSVARGADYLIYNIDLNDYMDSITHALDHIYTYYTSGPPNGWEGLVISMSWSLWGLTTSEQTQLSTMFNALADTGVLCVAASGNIYPWRIKNDDQATRVKQYDQPYTIHPQSFTSVLAVGACFDDAPYWNGGTELWESLPDNMRGRRISWARTQNLYDVTDPWDTNLETNPNYHWIWASNHWDQPDWDDWRMVAPGFCIEVYQPISDGYQQSADDVVVKNSWGTSPATAIVAAAAAVMKYYHPEDLLHLVTRLQKSSELTGATYPGPRPNVYDILYDEYRGWGILDIFDAWQYVHPP